MDANYTIVGNYTQGEMDPSDRGLRIFQYFDQTAYALVTLVLNIVAISASLFMIIVILISPKLRKSPKHFLILNLCFVCLIACAFPEALANELYFRNKWIHSCGLLLTIEMSSNVLLSIETLLVAVIGVTFILDRLLPVLSKGSLLYILTIVMAVVCWVGSSVILIPLQIKGLDKEISVCGLFLKSKFHIPFYVITFIPQSLFVLISVSVVLFAHIAKSEKYSPYNANTWFPLDIILACIVVVSLNLPWTIYIIGFSTCSDSSCQFMFRFHGVALRLSHACYTVLPLVWLFCRQIRESISQLMCCKCSEENSRRDEYNVQDEAAHELMER